MPTLFSKIMLLGLAVALMLAFASAPAQAQIVVKNEDVTFKFGIQGQLWGDWTQDSTGSQGYQQNFYLRRHALFSARISARTSAFSSKPMTPSWASSQRTSHPVFCSRTHCSNGVRRRYFKSWAAR